MEKLEQEYYFMTFSIVFEKVPEFALDRKQLKSIILQSVQSLHGQVGAAICLDIIRCEWRARSVTSLLRLPHKDLVKVWSALTLMGSYGNNPCSAQVHQVSGSLLALAASSRDKDSQTKT